MFIFVNIDVEKIFILEKLCVPTEKMYLVATFASFALFWSAVVNASYKVSCTNPNMLIINMS